MIGRKKAKNKKPLMVNPRVMRDNYLRPRASIRGIVVKAIKPEQVTLSDLEKDLKETRILLFVLLSLVVSLFGLMLGIVIKFFF